jgi:hypothetical protein
MKRASISLLALTLAFVFACQPAQNGNGNGNANANKSSNTNQSIVAQTVSTDKIVQIFINDDPAKPGYYEIEDPGAVTLHKKKNQKIAWCIIYEGKTPPSDVVIDNFRSPPPPAAPTASNPFGDGSAGDNTFTIPSADFNSCKHGTKTPKATSDIRTYKYMISVKVGAQDRGHLDPVVIIDN